MKRTSYDIIKSSISKEFTPSDEDLKRTNKFFLIRFISSDPSTISLANLLNLYPDIPTSACYKFIRNSSSSTKIAYPKNTLHDIIRDKNKLKMIMKYYKCSIKLAKRYYDILPEEQYVKITQYCEQSLLIKDQV